MLVLHNISYKHPNKDLLFSEINYAVYSSEKTALIGNNGAGKSTLLKLIAGELLPNEGQISIDSPPYYIPQIVGQFNHLTIAEALKVDNKIKSLHNILAGDLSEENYNLLEDDWTIEERCFEALERWQLEELDLTQKMGSLSGGQKTKVFLTGISIHQPKLILMDEPSNHLDDKARQLLYDFIQSTKCTLIVVSHDRKLLNILDSISELSSQGIKKYGGNFDFYKEQKQIENNALNQDIQFQVKALRKAKEKERDTIERQQKLDNRGKRKQEKAGVAKIMMNTLRNKAENSTTKLKSVHSEKLLGISNELQELRSSLPEADKIKFGFANSELHKGKILFKAIDINYTFHTTTLWNENLSFQIISGERITLKGANGSGKTTLIRLILNQIEPSRGSIQYAHNYAVYIDQDYSLLNNQLSVYEQAENFNNTALQEHEIKTRLNRFLFTHDYWNKACVHLSGGERMRLLLCCLTINNQSPDMIILDEPTNNLDLQNIEILTAAVNEYQGTLIVVSHDDVFLQQIHIEREIEL